MKRHLEGLLREALSRAAAAGKLAVEEVPPVVVEAPADPEFGDFASDLALRLARAVHEPPQKVAEPLVAHLHDPGGWLDSVEVAGPGFINFRLAPAFWQMLLDEAVNDGAGYGRSRRQRASACVRVLCDSAGMPLGLEPARAAVVGDATVRLLEAAGYEIDAAFLGTGSTGLPFPGVGPLRSAVEGEGTTPRVRVHRNGEVREIVPGPVRLSRAGETVPATLGALLERVSPEAARFFLLLGPAGAPLEIDLGLAMRERTDNPFFYVRYAEARLAHALGGPAHLVPPDSGMPGPTEVELIRVLASYPDVVDAAARDLEPHRIAIYALDLARAWHGYYNRRRAMVADPARRGLLECVRHALETALGLVGATKGA